MDSDSSDTFSPKLDDFELDDPDQSFGRDNRYNWTPTKTFELIKAYETECKELWDQQNAMYKNRMHRAAKLEQLARRFDTSPEEINRKLHNLRSQYCKELKKLRRFQEAAGDPPFAVGWEYFEAMTFLQKDPLNDTSSPSESTMPTSASMEDVKFELEQFQAQEQATFCGGAAPASCALLPGPPFPAPLSAPPAPAAPPAPPAPHPPGMRSTSRPRAPATLPLTEHVHPILWPEDPTRSTFTDECQIFGDFVASELRSLRSGACRKKLKRIIQKAILKVGEEDDEKVKRRLPSYYGSEDNDD